MAGAYILLHYAATVLAVALPAVGVSWSQGHIAATALQMINTQPYATKHLRNLFFLSSVVIEATVIIALIIGLMFSLKLPTNFITTLAHCGILPAIGICGLAIGILSTKPAQNALVSVAREPFEQTSMTSLVLITLSMIQTPVLFGFIISWLIFTQSTQADLSLALCLLASGLTLGLGALGPLRGLSLFARNACASIGINKKAYKNVISFTFVSLALIEAPILFSFLTSMLITIYPLGGYLTAMSGYKGLAAALTMALCTAGTGIGSGNVSGTACTAITQDPEQYSALSKMSLLSQVLIDSNAIYGFIIALFIVLF